MCTMWVPTNCPCNICRSYVHNVGTNKLPMQHKALCAQCGYQQIAHATYVGPMCTMWVPTNCPCNICRPYVHNVGTNKLPMQHKALCAQCGYQQISHATYVGPMCTMWVPTNCPCNVMAPMCTMWVPTNCPCNICRPYAQCGYNKLQCICRSYVHNVGTNKLPMQHKALCAQCGYQQIAHATYVDPMCTMWVRTNCSCNVRPYVHNVGTNKLPMQHM